MIGLYRKIDGDLLNISRRLKTIDKDYFVVFSYRDHRYEIHNKGNKGNTFCFWAPALDERVIVRARRTRRERIKKLLEEIESSNERMLKLSKEQTVKSIETGAEKVFGRGEKL